MEAHARTFSESDDEMQLYQDILVSFLSSHKGKTPNRGPIQYIRKEVAPNVFHTQGIHFIADGNIYVMAMEALQGQNVYQLHNGDCKIFSHIPLVKVATNIWDVDTDEDEEIAARALVDKHLMLSKAPQHLNPGEKTLHFAPIDCMKTML